MLGGIAIRVPPEWRVETAVNALGGGVAVNVPAPESEDAPTHPDQRLLDARRHRDRREARELVMRRATEYLVSVPERILRAVAAALGGTIHETAELVLPRLVRKSRFYEATAKNLLRITVELVGGVEREHDSRRRRARGVAEEARSAEGRRERRSSSDRFSRSASPRSGCSREPRT